MLPEILANIFLSFVVVFLTIAPLAIAFAIGYAKGYYDKGHEKK